MHSHSHFAYLASSYGSSRIIRSPIGLIVDSGAATPALNVVVSDGADLHIRAEDALGVCALFGARPFTWRIAPNVPEAFKIEVRRAGLVAAFSEADMRLSLAETSPRGAARGISITAASTLAEMLAWSSVIASHWVPPNREILRFYAQTAAAAIAPESPLVFLLAHLDNVLAGVAEVALSETKAAGLYNVMTLPAHRYRGVASALVEAAIEVAQRRGMQTLELQSTPAAFRIYASRGFQHEGDWRLKVGNHGVEAAARSGRGAA